MLGDRYMRARCKKRSSATVNNYDGVEVADKHIYQRDIISRYAQYARTVDRTVYEYIF